MRQKRKIKAIGLLSGGLDSTLAVKLMLDVGIDVVCFNLKTPFCLCDGKGGCYSEKVAKKYDLKLIKLFAGDDYIELVKNPEHGYGKNLNPCIDCRIFLFSKAKKVLEQQKADFIFTGEVLGERPMSQRKDAIMLIERESGLKGKVLRPLSAKHFEPTIPEKEGWVHRDKFLDIKGRSRKPQLALAENLGIKDFPCPAGGCLLTDQNFAKRLKDSFEQKEDSLRHISLLKVGRHFRLPSKAKVIAGRNETENKMILALAHPQEVKLTAFGYKSTYVLLLGEPNSSNLDIASRICARYCDQKDLNGLPIKFWTESEEKSKIIKTKSLDDFSLKKYIL